MDDLYFDWRSHILASQAKNEGFSLLELLDSIPTDIPRNASEYDEEIRNLIISLYSDAKETSKQDIGDERKEDISSYNTFENASLEMGDIETEGGSNVFRELSWTLGRNSLQVHTEAEMSIESSVSGAKSSTRNSLVPFQQGHNQKDADDVRAELMDHSFLGDDIESQAIQSSSDSTLDDSLLMQYDQNELKIFHDTGIGFLANEITRDCPLQDSIEAKAPGNTEQDGLGQEFEVGIDGSSIIDLQYSVKSQSGDFQKNLDDLGDSKTAAILNSVTGWFTRISRDPSKDLLGSVSLLGDLPSEATLDTDFKERILEPETSDSMKHGMNIFRYEIEDKFSLPSEVSKIDDTIRQHSLSVIEEENDIHDAAKQELLTSHSDVSLLNSSLALSDSGLGLLSGLTLQDEIQPAFTGILIFY